MAAVVPIEDFNALEVAARSLRKARIEPGPMVSGAAVAIISVILAVPFSTSGTTTAVLEWLDNLAWFGLAALPASMGVAILKYRLYDAGRTVAAFAARLTGAIDPGTVQADLASVVHQALEPAHVSLWISQRD